MKTKTAVLKGKPYAGDSICRFLLCLLLALWGVCWSCAAQEMPKDGKIKTGLYVGHGGRSNGAISWLLILNAAPEVELTLLEGADVRAGCLKDIDVLVVPGGSSPLQAKSLGPDGLEEVRRYLREGGRYFGTCAGCSLAANRKGMLRLIPYVKRSVKVRRGSTMLGMDFTPEGMAAFGLSVSNRNVCYHSGPLLTPTEPIPEVSNLRILATFAGSIMQNGPVDFEMQGHPAIIHANYGKGVYLVTAYHPEYYPMTQDLIAGGFRLLTGRAITIKHPRRSSRSRPVGYYTPGVMGKASYAPVLELVANRNIDLHLVDNAMIESGGLSHLESLILPDGDATHYKTLLSKGFAHNALVDFVRQGGRVFAWGAGVEVAPPGTERVKAERIVASVLEPASAR